MWSIEQTNERTEIAVVGDGDGCGGWRRRLNHHRRLAQPHKAADESSLCSKIVLWRYLYHSYVHILKI
jgi:hypothetical protein